MEHTQVRCRSYMVVLQDGSDSRSRFVICEVERTKLEIKRFCVWAYSGYPNEIEDITSSLSESVRQELRRHTMRLMSDENLWDAAGDQNEDSPGDGLGV